MKPSPVIAEPLELLMTRVMVATPPIGMVEGVKLLVKTGTAKALTLSVAVPLELGALAHVAVAVLVFVLVAVTTMVTVQLPLGASVMADKDTLPPPLAPAAVALEPLVQLMVRLALPEFNSVPV